LTIILIDTPNKTQGKEGNDSKGLTMANLYESVTQAFLELGCTKSGVKKSTTKIKHIVKLGGLRDYINSAEEVNKKYNAKLFSRTPPWIDAKISDNVVIFHQIVSKCYQHSDIRLRRALKSIRTILDHVLCGYDYIELPIGGCANYTLTPLSDLDIPVITSCPNAGRNQLATIAIVVGLIEVCKDVPCGSTFSVRFVDSFLTAQSISQHSTKTAIFCSVPHFMRTKQRVFYDSFLAKAYGKLKKINQGRMTLNDYYCVSLQDYMEDIRRKLYSGEKVSMKDLQKLLTLNLHFHFTKERGINLLRGKKFSELFFDAVKTNSHLEGVQDVLVSVFKKAKLDPDKEVLSYKISQEITTFYDIMNRHNLWFN